MNHYTFDILILFLLVALSAFFSASESALFSLKKPDLHRFGFSKSSMDRSIARLMERPQGILITILIGNLLTHLFMSAISTRIFLERWSEYGHIVSILVITPVIIIFGEITPKMIAIRIANRLCRVIYPPLRLVHAVLFPMRIMLQLLTDAVIRLFRLSMEHTQITADELDLAVNIGEQEGVIDRKEGSFIKNVLRFSRKDASHVMFPRASALFIPRGATVDDAMKLFEDWGVIRAPVYHNDYDHIVGMIDSRELIPSYLGLRRGGTINRFIKPIAYYPSTRDLGDLLQDFITDGVQIAIIVDEYGGTAGVMSLNRMLSQLMGRDLIRWEEDSRGEFRRGVGNSVIISGEMQIDDYNIHFGENLTSQNSYTVGGYIIERISDFPRRGEEIMTAHNVLRVRYVRKNKIESVEVIPHRSAE